MDDMTKSETTIAWLWIIEAMASFKEVSLSLIRDLLEAAPELPCELAENVKERVALRCLEDLCARKSRRMSENSSSRGSKIEFDTSESCQNVLQRIVKETPECDLKSGGTGLSKYDILSFVRHKETHFPKLALEKLRDSIIDGTHPYADLLRDKSGLESASREDGVVMDGKNQKNPVSARPNLTYNDVGTKRAEVSSHSLVIKNKDKQLESNSQNENLPSKRVRSDSGGDNHKAGKLENHNRIDSSDAQNVNTEKANCQVSDDNQSSEQNLVPLREKELDKEASPEAERNVSVTTSGCDLAGRNMDIAEEETNRALEGGSDDLTVSKKSNFECENNEVHRIGTEDPRNESQVDLSPDVPIEVNENRAEPSGFSIEEPVSKTEQNAQFQEPNFVSNGGSQEKTKALEENNNAECSREAEISSDVDGIQDVWTDVAKKKHKFQSSQTNKSPVADSLEDNLCMKCNEAGQALACNGNNCQVMVHEKCLGSPVVFDDKGSFYCPFCAYSLAIAEYLESKKRSSVSRKDLSVLIRSGSVEPRQIKSSNKKKKDREGLCKDANILRENQKEGIRVATNVSDENGCEAHNVAGSSVLFSENADLESEKGNKVIISEENTDADRVNIPEEDSEARPKKIRPEKSSKKRKKHRKGLCEDENQLGENQKDVHLEERVEENRPEFRNVTESSTSRDKKADLVREKGKKVINGKNKVPQKSDDIVNETKEDLEAWPKIVKQKDVDAANQLAQDFSIDSSASDGDDNESSIAKFCISVRERETRSQIYPAIQASPVSGRQILPWTFEEEQKLKEGVEKFIHRSHIPWKKILEFGKNVFLDCRTMVDLHDKWRNMSESSKRKRRV